MNNRSEINDSYLRGYAQGREDAIKDAKEKISEYASIWMSYTDTMTKEQIAQEALDSAKQAMINILDKIKEKPLE